MLQCEGYMATQDSGRREFACENSNPKSGSQVNALSSQMVSRLHEVFMKCEKDPEVKFVTLMVCIIPYHIGHCIILFLPDHRQNREKEKPFVLVGMLGKYSMLASKVIGD
ncbi:hypothetical protein C5167_040706 [Papaver somniferum]|uniref:Uncharacterized protein n=1 Tax=Papaver somniferum TaxID=3469 RepID=A0A4Y7IJX3_PAPSO|nr:hypothetical protein C5167_040706 [Papaver somniferum]